MSDAETVTVALGERAYEIVVGEGLLGRAGAAIAPLLARPEVVVVTDETVAGLHLDTLATGLDDAGIGHRAIVLPPGERTKDFAHLERLVDALLEARVERDDTIVAFGGGVVGDIAGFAASILRRGVGMVQVPTTLLAQVDSSVGGKTGINTPRGKNLVGSFHQPRLVLADIDLLDTLPSRELLAGYAEVVKYGLIDDPALFTWLERHGGELLAGDKALRRQAVAASCRAKARVVARDEREAGARALLNLGHTFGHALEAAAGYDGRLLHGEAVAVGMVMAFDLSVRLGLCPPGDADRVRRHLAAVGLPVARTAVAGGDADTGVLLEHMKQDKKARDGRPVFVLANGIGRAFLTRDVAPEAVRSLLEEVPA